MKVLNAKRRRRSGMVAFVEVERQTVTLTEAAKILGISRSKAYRLVAAGTFPVPVIRVGGSVVVPVKPLQRLLEEGTAACGHSCIEVGIVH
jgi:excisionase family DNA binding protein